MFFVVYYPSLQYQPQIKTDKNWCYKGTISQFVPLFVVRLYFRAIFWALRELLKGQGWRCNVVCINWSSSDYRFISSVSFSLLLVRTIFKNSNTVQCSPRTPVSVGEKHCFIILGVGKELFSDVQLTVVSVRVGSASWLFWSIRRDTGGFR